MTNETVDVCARPHLRTASARRCGEPVVLHWSPDDPEEVREAATEGRALVAYCGATRVPHKSPFPRGAVLCVECTRRHLALFGVDW